MTNLWKAENNTIDSVDSSPGTLMGGTGFAAGKVGQAFSFDGVNDHITLSNFDGLNFDVPATYEFWYKSDVDCSGMTPESCSVGGNIVFSRGWSYSEASRFLLFVGATTSTLNDELLCMGNVNAGHSDVICHITSDAGLVVDQEWHHVVWVFDSSDASLFVDGSELALISPSGNEYDGSIIIDDIDYAYLGARYYLGNIDNYLDGSVDEFAIFNRALDITEIQTMYYNGLNDKGYCEAPLELPTCGEDYTQGMISYWEAEGDVTDSFDGNDGTFVANTYSTGKVGDAFSLDGVDDYVQIPDSADWHFGSNDFSIFSAFQ